jgi:aspartokinase
MSSRLVPKAEALRKIQMDIAKLLADRGVKALLSDSHEG